MFFIQEFKEINFNDKRLKQRFTKIGEDFMSRPGSIIKHSLSGNSSNIKGAYRFFNNSKVKETKIQQEHQRRTVERSQEVGKGSFILSIQDTTTCNYNSRPGTKGLGKLWKNQHNTTLGFCLHHTFCVSSQDDPLGLLTQKMYTHKSNEVCHKKRSLIEKASYRWVEALRTTKKLLPDAITIADRESDFFDFLEEAYHLQAKIIIRATENRYLQTALGTENLIQYLKKQPILNSYTYQDPQTKQQVQLNVHTAYRVQISYPKSRGKTQSEPIYFNVIHVENKDIEWTLITNLDSSIDEKTIVHLYTKRWHVENLHKTMKSCFNIEKAQLESFEGLKKLIILLNICAVRLYMLTWKARCSPNQSCQQFITEPEWKALFLLQRKKMPSHPPPLHEVCREIAILGGYLNRKNDPQPGVIVMSRGWIKLQNAVEMYNALCQ
jgi:hypothetical protein